MIEYDYYIKVVNPHLLRDLTERDLWDDEMKNQIISRNGSIQGIDEIPDDIKALYKTVWEVSQKTILKMAADRGAFIDQSQSLNVHVAEPNYGKLTSMHFYGWKLGLKTGKLKQFIDQLYRVLSIEQCTITSKN